MKLTFIVNEQGKLPQAIKNTLARVIPEMANKKVTLTLIEAKDKRSLQQNSYWFAMLDKYVVPVFREAGSNWSDFDIHEEIMKELGYEKAMVKPNGEIVAKRLHSSEFDVKAWEEFMERARAHLATEYDIFLPLPNEDLTVYER